MPDTSPALIIVNGLPATGKTTLSVQLADALGLALFSKDMFKEILFDTLGWSDRDWSRRLGVASIALLVRVAEAELRAGRSCVVECNFDPQLGTEQLNELRARYPFQPVQVLCMTDPAVRRERQRQRAHGAERHPGHLEATLLAEVDAAAPVGRMEPLALGGALIEVDTTDPAAVDVAALAARLRAEIGQ
jgi:predicted kinase